MSIDRMILVTHWHTWWNRSDSLAGIGGYSCLVGFSSSLLLTAGETNALGTILGHWLLSGILASATLALAIVLRVVLFTTLIRLPLAISGVAILGYALLDAYQRGLFGHHLSASELATAWDAMRTGALPLPGGDLALLLIGACLGVVLSIGLLSVLARVPGPRWSGPGPYSAALYGALFLSFFFRDLWTRPEGWFDQVFGLHQRREDTRASRDSTQVDLGPALQAGLFERLSALGTQPSLGVHATRTPDIVFIHAESLRADHFTDAILPNTISRTKSCLIAERHYSTGFSTQNGVGGALTGLSPVYLELVRRQKLAPLPLRALRELGYTNHVWFPNEALEFDDILGTIVGPHVQVHRASKEPVHEADALTASEFEHRELSAPRFDYVVLDSSHYDYSYPDSFERFLPSSSFGLRFNPRTGEGLEESSNDILRSKFEVKIKNRYKNSLLYLDTLAARILDAGQSSKRETVLVFFGDHGEAFWDRGGPFGHTTELSEAQVRTPLVICFPEDKSTRYHLSSHADLFPTVFDFMGVRAEAPFMSGKSLLQFDPALDFVVARGTVTSFDASRRYLIVRGDTRVSLLQTDPPAFQRVETLGEELLTPMPRDATAGSLVAFLQSVELRFPATAADAGTR